jgi:hypothetical protein
MLRLSAIMLLWAATWELSARVEDWLVAGIPPWRPYAVNALFRPSEVGREGVPHARFGKWRMNRLGFRGDEPMEGRVGVLAFGASETFGLYESPGHEYPRLLQGELDARVPGTYGVHNVALPGMRIGRIAYLERALDRTGPRYAVIYPTPAGYIGAERPYCREPVFPARATLGLADHLRLTGRMGALFDRAMPEVAVDAMRRVDLWLLTRGIAVAPRVPGATVEAFAVDLECALDAIVARGAVPVLVTHATRFGDVLRPEERPTMTAWRRFYPDLAEEGFLDLERRANAVVREAARRRGAPLFDAAAEIAPGRGNFADFAHFTDQGASAVARGIARTIADHAASTSERVDRTAHSSR